jgi:hypothetical protein
MIPAAAARAPKEEFDIRMTNPGGSRQGCIPAELAKSRDHGDQYWSWDRFFSRKTNPAPVKSLKSSGTARSQCGGYFRPVCEAPGACTRKLGSCSHA